MEHRPAFFGFDACVVGFVGWVIGLGAEIHWFVLNPFPLFDSWRFQVGVKVLLKIASNKLEHDVLDSRLCFRVVFKFFSGSTCSRIPDMEQPLKPLSIKKLQTSKRWREIQPFSNYPHLKKMGLYLSPCTWKGLYFGIRKLLLNYESKCTFWHHFEDLLKNLLRGDRSKPIQTYRTDFCPFTSYSWGSPGYTCFDHLHYPLWLVLPPYQNAICGWCMWVLWLFFCDHVSSISIATIIVTGFDHCCIRIGDHMTAIWHDTHHKCKSSCLVTHRTRVGSTSQKPAVRPGVNQKLL